MNRPLGRRAFLKVLAALPPGLALSSLLRKTWPALPDAAEKNVLIIVFDALSARNISLYGYARETMPNLARLAERATLYHRHHSGGNFTTPGTASILTGTYPWTHRAVRIGARVREDRADRNIFNLFAGFDRFGYSHNDLVNVHFDAFRRDIDFLKPQKELFVRNPFAFDRWFAREHDLANIAWGRTVKKRGRGYAYSLFLSDLYTLYGQAQRQELQAAFPVSIPRIGPDDYFLLEEAVDWLGEELAQVRQPFFGYVHFLPPHSPYSPRREFLDRFTDDAVIVHVDKPKHPVFRQTERGEMETNSESRERQRYDQFVLYADAELGRLLDFLDSSGLSANTWIVFTSDHGELFERGIIGHITPVLYEPVVHVPLLIAEPGQAIRRDIYTTTSAVDLLPTLLHVTGKEIPHWAEGHVLPPFAGAPVDPARSIVAVESKETSPAGPLSPLTAMLIKGDYKLMYFVDYEEMGGQHEYFEMYNLAEDPQELNNLYWVMPGIARELRDELRERRDKADQPFR